MKAAFLVLLAVSTAADGQGVNATADDPRIAIVRFVPDQPIAIQTADGVGMLILLPQGERIQRITLGNPSDYQVRPSAADGISLLPVRGASSTTMQVETSERNYDFSLVPTVGADAPIVIRLAPNSVIATVAPILPQGGDLTPYKVSGSDALRPQSINDDGLRTYIRWGESQLIPAVFAIGTSGHEEMVDGYMRAGIFTIDRVYEKLIFRIDQSLVTATRLQKGTHRHAR